MYLESGALSLTKGVNHYYYHEVTGLVISLPKRQAQQ
jgi:hypothetical protein